MLKRFAVILAALFTITSVGIACTAQPGCAKGFSAPKISAPKVSKPAPKVGSKLFKKSKSDGEEGSASAGGSASASASAEAQEDCEDGTEFDD